jgi:hypothetical protein
VATERQIAANRRSASRSTGPRSDAGKERASRNARTHGLTTGLLGGPSANQVDKLARKIGRTKDKAVFEYARTAAQAELDLVRVRQARVALIDRVWALGTLDAPRPFSVREVRLLAAALWGRAAPATSTTYRPPNDDADRGTGAHRRGHTTGAPEAG